jgi:ATP-binding cassette, subfamily B, multidrug efflux pump
MFLSLGFSRVIPWILKLAIDALGEGAGRSEITRYTLYLVGAAALGGAFLYAQRWLLIGTSRLVEYDLRQKLFCHLQTLDPAAIGNKRTGDMMAHFTNDLSAVRDVAGPGIMYAGTMSVMLTSSITLMVILSPKLTLLAFAPYPFISVITFFFGRAMHKRSRHVQDLFGKISARVQEDLSGIRVIRTFVQEDNVSDNFKRLNDEYVEANMAVAALRARFIASMNLLAGLGLAIALLVGGRQVIGGTLSLGSLVAFSAYLAEMTWPVIAIGFIISRFQTGASAAARINEMLDQKPLIRSGLDAGLPAPNIHFDHVSFAYPGSEANAVVDLDFTLGPGQTLGIVGRTGSGKSTLLKLLLRFYDPTEGRILIDQVDLRERDLAAVRSQIGYAPQDAFLFSRSIAENIAYGDPDASAGRISAAAGIARLAEEVDGFPDGLETIVGERGITLSGGQRQRASLARAVLLEPRILLLDDTLSAVDAHTEREILGELREITAHRTSIIVSHRISAVRHADLILVLEDGAVTERGRHGELLSQGGLYARLHERQRLKEEIEEAEL